MALLSIDLPDEIAVTDSIEVELLSFSPRIEDSVEVTDVLTAETEYHRELADAVEVTDSIEIIKSQVPGEIHVEIADAVEVADSIEALLFDGVGPVVVTSVTPQRGRAGDPITIRGTGFSPDNNNVRLDGNTATILSESETEIVITQPTTFSVTAGHAVLQVNNFDNNRVMEVPFWVQDTLANLEAKRLPDQEDVDGSFVGAAAGASANEDPARAEAQDWQRAATVVDFLTRDLLVALGDIFVRDGTGLTVLDGSLASEETGQRLVADSAASEGVRWGHAFDGDVPYGIQIPAGTTTGVLMTANGVNTAAAAGASDEWPAPLDGTIDGVYVYQQSSIPNTDTLDRVRILVEGVAQYDSTAGLGISHRGRHFAGNLSISVSAGDRIQLEVTKAGTNETMDLLGAVRMMST